jgi:regulator of RNase E activity RraA
MSDAHDFVPRLRRLDACAVSDALDSLGLSGSVSGVPQVSGDGRIAGRAVTMKLGVGEPPPGPPRHLGTTAIEAAGPENVIVIEQRSGIDCGSWGGLLSLGAQLRGVAGVVCDGPVRDIDEARAYGFPIFTRKLTARTGRGPGCRTRHKLCR